ncbi:F-box protein FBW2 [Phalaenopsis equestris]|uniref:F-box protein FBW2 n=1 Tax=Phalaenopsis equestris TaxID=78828 RepID=UPI0009E1E97D|nr:F-box protein FBW2 [Phalaenopsis equestris]
MGEFAELRSWEELIPDALGLIFRNLSLQQILSVVPRVCKSWSRAVSGPYCWQEIDLEEWSRRVNPEQIERMLHLLVRRSSGYCRRLAISGLPNDSLFSFIADYAGSLQSLEVPRSEMSDAIVEQVAGSFSNITFLDISSCKNIGVRALKSFGMHCKSLATLRRTMHPLDVAGKVCQDDEALAIALTMPKLRHLELAYLLLTTQGVLQILSHCQELEFLDIRGCWDVKLDERLVKEKNGKLRVLGPEIVDSYERSFWNECSDYSDSSEYSWDFMDDGDAYSEDMSDEQSVWDDDVDEQNLERLQVRFYGGGFNEAFAGFEWPLSP